MTNIMNKLSEDINNYEKRIFKLIKNINKNYSKLYKFKNNLQKIKNIQSDINDDEIALQQYNASYENKIKTYYNNLLETRSLIELNKFIEKFSNEHKQLLTEINKQKIY